MNWRMEDTNQVFLVAIKIHRMSPESNLLTYRRIRSQIGGVPSAQVVLSKRGPVDDMSMLQEKLGCFFLIQLWQFVWCQGRNSNSIPNANNAHLNVYNKMKHFVASNANLNRLKCKTMIKNETTCTTHFHYLSSFFIKETHNILLTSVNDQGPAWWKIRLHAWRRGNPPGSPSIGRSCCCDWSKSKKQPSCHHPPYQALTC